MIHYLLVYGDPAAVRGVAGRVEPAIEASRVMNGEVTVAAATNGTWLLAAVKAPDLLCSDRVLHAGTDLAVVNGTALVQGAPQSTLMPEVMRRYRDGGSKSVLESLGSAFNFLGINDERGLTACTDFTGLYPLYHESIDGLVVVSNRSSSVSSLLRLGGWNLDALAFILGHSSLFGPDLPAPGVQHLVPGEQLVVQRPGDPASVGRGPGWAWPAPGSGPGRANLDSAEWDDVVGSLLRNFEALASVDAPLRLGLTGGKDSRVVLGLARVAGVEIDVVTTGPADSPEVQVASEVARIARVEHRTPTAMTAVATRPDGRPGVDPENAWSRLRHGMYRFEGIISGWSAANHPTNRAFGLKGFGGELYRRGNTNQRVGGAQTVAALADQFVHFQQRHDPLGVLQRSEVARQSGWMKDWVHTHADEVRFDLLAEKLYVDQRLGHWTGALLQASPARIEFNPLLSNLAISKNLELRAETRASERLHYEVLRRVAPELVPVPFLNDTWSAAIRSESRVELPSEPFPVTSLTPRKGHWGNPSWSLLDHDRDGIHSLFVDGFADTALGSICNEKKLFRALESTTGESEPLLARAMFGALGCAILLLGRQESVTDQMS